MQTNATVDSLAPLLPLPDGASRFADALDCRRLALGAAMVALSEQAATLAEVCELLTLTLERGDKLLAAGNGGSAAEAQHFAGELVGRFKRERRPWPVIALCTDSAIVTAIGNDYGFAEVFARQVAGLGRAGDALIVFSTSGESENLVRAAHAARAKAMTTIAVTGARECRLGLLADHWLRAQSDDTPVVQELHMVLSHLLCEAIETRLTASPNGVAAGNLGEVA